MEIEKKTTGDVLEMRLPGRIDDEAAHQLEMEITDACKVGVQAIHLDLSQATFLCSLGIRVLLKYRRKMNDKGPKLWVLRPSPAVKEVLDLTGFAAYLLVRDPPDPE